MGRTLAKPAGAPRRVQPKVFCVEGEWSPRLTDQFSVLPLLVYLKGVGQIDFIHRQVETVEGLLNVVRRWPQKQYTAYSLGYFGFHGEPGRLLLGRRSLELEELGEVLRGKCAGKVLYFGSCALMDIPTRRIQRFRRLTGARCVAGYREDVDFFESAAFDMLLLEALTWYRRMDAVDNWLGSEYGQLVRRLSFRMYYG